VGARWLLFALAFLPLAVGVYPGDLGIALVRLGLAVVAYAFLLICPTFNEELSVHPRGRAWQALLGVALGAAAGIGRGMLGRTSPWAGLEAYRSTVAALNHPGLGPALALLELLPALVLAGVLEAVVYAGMARWVVSRPRGPLWGPFAVVLASLLYAWLHFCVPRFPDSFSRFGPELQAATAYAGVALVNGILMSLGTLATRSPLLAGAFLGTQWWACLAIMCLGWLQSSFGG